MSNEDRIKQLRETLDRQEVEITEMLLKMRQVDIDRVKQSVERAANNAVTGEESLMLPLGQPKRTIN